MRKHGLFLFGAKNTASFMEVRGLTLKGEITMMKAIKNFMNKPITYGAYFKYCTVCASISLALCGWAYYQMSKLNNWVDKKIRGRDLSDFVLFQIALFVFCINPIVPLWRRQLKW